MSTSAPGKARLARGVQRRIGELVALTNWHVVNHEGTRFVTETRRVYIFGHPSGNELSFSFQDNQLLDHEGPPRKPTVSGRVRVHYRTPTEPGNSGSPVFNDDWK